MNLKEALQEKKRFDIGTLLSENGSNPKIVKSNEAKLGYYTSIMHLAPAKLSGYEVCPGRSSGCTKACLHTSGAKHYQKIKDKYRINKTKFLFESPDAFEIVLNYELENHIKKSKKLRLKPSIRLNGTSDIIWEKKFPNIFDKFSKCQFYDYTKIVKRLNPKWDLPKNYYLIFSMSETVRNQNECKKAINWGHNIAVVFQGYGWSRYGTPFPDYYLDLPIIDGDKHDLRFLDAKNSVVGLRAKGKAYKEDSKGFAINLPVLNVA